MCFYLCMIVNASLDFIIQPNLSAIRYRVPSFFLFLTWGI